MVKKFEYRRRVVHCCGHTVNHLLRARNRQEADSWAYNLRRTECPASRGEVLRDNELEKESCRTDFPELEGASALVAWAGAIRSKIYGALSRSGRYHGVAYLCRYETSAEWWIKHRSDRFCDIVAHLRHLERGRVVAA